MQATEFMQLLKAVPFVPLRILMTDGRTYDIYHPDNVLVLRSRIVVGMSPDPQNGILERTEHCSLLHIVRIEELPVPTKPMNGTA